MSLEFDLIVLGGGPGGYVAALRAGQLGLKVCLIEKDALGGVCLNRGCIPSKTLLAGTELFTKIQKAGDWGIEIPGQPVWNKKKLFEKKDQVVARMRQGLDILCQKRKVHRVNGEGVVIGPTQVRVGQETYQAKHLILATGSSARQLDLGIDPAFVLTSEQALQYRETPKELLILGGGPEGVEFALVYQGLGSKVTVIEAKERLLPGFDRDAGAAMRRALVAKGIEVRTSDRLLKATTSGGRVSAQMQNSTDINADAILVSIGRVPNTAEFASLELKLDAKKALITDEQLRTSEKNIFAIGDVNGRWMMAHSASYEGYIVAGQLAGKDEKPDYSAVPSCVYTYPEVAEVGLNQEKAEAMNIPIETGRFSFAALGRAQAKGQTDGFVKLIGESKTNRVLGGVIVGDGAPELINMISVAVKNKLKMQDLRTHVSPHPSASEAVVEAAHLFFKEGLHFA